MMIYRLTASALTLLALTGCDNYLPAKSEPAAASVPSASLYDTEHNARTSLDWAGSYQGVLPCADCDGIATKVVLHDDGQYQLSQQYLGKSTEVFSRSGRFRWSESGSIVLLEADQPVQFFVGENQLFMLDQQGQRIDGELASHYRLQKLLQ